MRFECTHSGHNKFWEYEGPRRRNNSFEVIFSWGKIGSTPQSQTQRFISLGDADSFIIKKVREKTGKGYVEVADEPLPQSISDIWYGDKKTPSKKATKPTPKEKVKEGIDPIDFDLATADAVKK